MPKTKTDLKTDIGTTAGEVWHALSHNSTSNVVTLARTLKRKPEEVHLALGWLARENKVELVKEKQSLKATLTPEEQACARSFSSSCCRE